MEAVDFRRNKRLLNRYRFIEHELVKILAGWLPATPHMETKLEVGRLLWEDAQHIQHLYARLREVQSPAFRPPGDEALERLMHEALHAPSADDLLGAVFRVIKPALVEAYRWHGEQTFANPDAPTRYYLRHILLDETAHVEWAQAALVGRPTMEWEDYVAALLAAAGGVTGQEERVAPPQRPTCWTAFQPPRTAARDERFKTDADSLAVVVENDPADESLVEFQNYAQEALAAETAALVLHLTADKQWELTYDLARHVYDETRHCKLGIEWLARHGRDYTVYPQMVRTYQWRSQYDPLTQYALLTMGNESHVFPYRQQRLKEYRATGDRLSEQYLSYDMADERQHVAFGHKWLPALIAWQGEMRSPDEVVASVVALWEREYMSGALPLHGDLMAMG